MPTLLRRLALLALVPSALVWTGAVLEPATAAFEPNAPTPAALAEEQALDKMLAQRAAALAALDQRADVRDRQLLGRQAVLARFGYHGDPDTVRVVLPLASYSVSAAFGLTGPLWEAEHGGQDFGAASGESLVAVSAGTITEVADAGPYGLRTILTLDDGTEVWYCHQSSVSAVEGQRVDVAEPIGSVGSTGNSVGPHLHLEIRPDGEAPIDPMAWLREAGLAP